MLCVGFKIYKNSEYINVTLMTLSRRAIKCASCAHFLQYMCGYNVVTLELVQVELDLMVHD